MVFRGNHLFKLLFIIVIFHSTNTQIYDLGRIKAKRHLSLRSLNPINTVAGNSYEIYYYYTYLYLGNPPMKQSYIIDTGSSITTAPCQPYCTHCGQHENSYYSVNSSDQVISCKNEFCNLVSSSCSGDKCSFSISYSEGSSLRGIYINETVRFGDDYKDTQGSFLPIGCTTNENNLFYTQLADGIMGLSNSDLNFVTMLYKRKLVKNNLFSMCLAQDGGYMSLGEISDQFHKEKVTFIDGDRGGFYYIKVNGVKVASKDMNLNKPNTTTPQYSAFIDSGTTVTYLPKAIFEFLIKSIIEHCELPEHKGRCGKYKNSLDLGPCFDFTSKDAMLKGVYQHWPNITYKIDNIYDYVLEPKNYWFDNSEGKKYEACLGFMQEYGTRLTLGGTWMHGHDVVFDRGNTKIGFALSDCSRGKDKDPEFKEEKHEPIEEPTKKDDDKPKEQTKKDDDKPKEQTKNDDKPKEQTKNDDKSKEQTKKDDETQGNNDDNDDSKQNEKDDEILGLEISLYLLAGIVCILTILIIVLLIAIRRLKNGQSFLCIKYNFNMGYQATIEQPSIELSAGTSIINSSKREKKSDSEAGLAKVKIVDS